MSKIRMSILVAITILLFSVSNLYAAAYYRCIITKVQPKANDVVDLTVNPAPGETRFSGNAKVKIDPADLGSKSMLATVLTAVSLNMEVGILLDVPPALTPQYTVDGISLVMQ